MTCCFKRPAPLRFRSGSSSQIGWAQESRTIGRGGQCDRASVLGQKAWPEWLGVVILCCRANHADLPGYAAR